MNIRKCAVIGCGFVGAVSAYTLAQSGLLEELVLLDVNRAKAEGEAMDISDGLPFLSPVKIYAGDYPELADCGLIVIAAGVNQKPGETRIDLLRRNAAIMSSICTEIVKYNEEAILLVVSNPVDLLTSVAQRVSGLPRCRVIGSGTVLDTARLKQLLGERLGVDSRNIHAFVIGEHGDSELPVWSSANVSGIDLCGFCGLTACGRKEELDAVFSGVRDSAYRIIERKGVTCYAIAQAVLRIARCIIRDENSVLTVSVFPDGHYGLCDVCLGLPAIVGAGGVKKILDIPLDAEEQRQLQASAEHLSEALTAL